MGEPIKRDPPTLLGELKRRPVGRVLLLYVAILGLLAAAQTPPTLTQRYDFEDPSNRVSLRHRLDEASGLAATEGGRVFTHGDERAVVYEVDPETGTILKQFSMGAPVLEGDFEGMYRIRLSDLSVEPESIRVPEAGLEAFGLSDHFAPSGVEVDPETGSLILISARQESIIEITAEGRIISGFHLGSNRHPRVEGISILPDGTLLLADERWERRAHITTYSRRPTPPANDP